MNAPSIDEIGRLLIDCPDGPGIVAAVAGLLAANGANITDAQQHSTGAFDGTFFLRPRPGTKPKPDTSNCSATRST
jgi:formyltetrahydrofolate deformylase